MFAATTIHAKYVFLDIVDFTKNRSVEAQADIVSVLNNIVASSITTVNLPKDNLIFIPTGDGICIALLNIESPYDAHILTALSIVKGIDEHNKKTENAMRAFQVRIGINSNTDNLITDINGNQNLAGAGISMASRVMDMADGNQILVGESVFDTLRYREQYMSAFRAFSATVKHGVQLPIYQFVSNGQCGLNTEVPQAFQVKKTDPVLVKITAYYFAHAIRHKDFLLEKLVVVQAGEA
jgi:class 3 adenylate cyclase